MQVARLAKFWNSTIAFTTPIGGRSAIMELIGITAGRQEEEESKRKGTRPSMTRAYRLFLEQVQAIDTVRIVYDTFYSKADIPREILSQTPLILDPFMSLRQLYEIV